MPHAPSFDITKFRSNQVYREWVKTCFFMPIQCILPCPFRLVQRNCLDIGNFWVFYMKLSITMSLSTITRMLGSSWNSVFCHGLCFSWLWVFLAVTATSNWELFYCLLFIVERCTSPSLPVHFYIGFGTRGQFSWHHFCLNSTSR